MKRYLFTTALSLIAVIATAQDNASNDSVFYVHVASNGNMSVAEKSAKFGAIETDNNNQTYIYTSLNYIQFKPDSTITSERIEIAADGPDFRGKFYNREFKKEFENNKDEVAANSFVSIKFSAESYPNFKLKVNGRITFVRQPNKHSDWTPNISATKTKVTLKSQPADKQPANSGITDIELYPSDTLIIGPDQSIQSITVTKPKYSQFEIIELINKKDGTSILSADTTKIEGGNNSPYDYYTTFTREIDGQLPDMKNYDTLILKVTYRVMNDSGFRTDLKTNEFPIVLEHPKTGFRLPLWVVWTALGIAAIIVFMFFIVNKKNKDEEKDGNESTPDDSAPDNTPENDVSEEDSSKSITHNAGDISKLREELESLKKRLETQQSGWQEERKALLESAKSKFKELNAARTAAEQELATVKTELNTAIKKLNTATTELNTTKQQLGIAKQSENSTMSQLQETKQKLKTLKDSTEQLKLDHEREKTDIREQYDIDISKIRIAAEKEKEDLAAQYNNEFEKLKSDIRHLQDIIAEDRTSISGFYDSKLADIKKHIEIIKNDADEQSTVFSMIDSMATSTNGINAFVQKCIEAFKSDENIRTVFETLKQTFIDNLTYNMSWCNSLARLYAYSRLGDEECAEIFGYYTSYRENLGKAFKEMISLAEIFGISEITVPQLFVEKFDSSKYECNNSGLFIPAIYPNYAKTMESGRVFDLATVGYDDGNTHVKATVGCYIS